ncbi:unnamed protein product [Coregonus sp. 'balchen']|nr:unnamed protein product [Coregonus sp. 'balchen']
MLLIKKEYGNNLVPAFPPKKIFTLTPADVEQRREQLEKYMQAVRQDPMLGASEMFNSFLRKAQQETQQIPTEEVCLEIYLSNGQKVKVNILTSDQTEDVLEAVASKLDLPDDLVGYFSLFLVREGMDGGLTSSTYSSTRRVLYYFHLRVLYYSDKLQVLYLLYISEGILLRYKLRGYRHVYNSEVLYTTAQRYSTYSTLQDSTTLNAQAQGTLLLYRLKVLLLIYSSAVLYALQLKVTLLLLQLSGTPTTLQIKVTLLLSSRGTYSTTLHSDELYYSPAQSTLLLYSSEVLYTLQLQRYSTASEVIYYSNTAQEYSLLYAKLKVLYYSQLKYSTTRTSQMYSTLKYSTTLQASEYFLHSNSSEVLYYSNSSEVLYYSTLRVLYYRTAQSSSTTLNSSSYFYYSTAQVTLLLYSSELRGTRQLRGTLHSSNRSGGYSTAQAQRTLDSISSEYAIYTTTPGTYYSTAHEGLYYSQPRSLHSSTLHSTPGLYYSTAREVLYDSQLIGTRLLYAQKGLDYSTTPIYSTTLTLYISGRGTLRLYNSEVLYYSNAHRCTPYYSPLKYLRLNYSHSSEVLYYATAPGTTTIYSSMYSTNSKTAQRYIDSTAQRYFYSHSAEVSTAQSTHYSSRAQRGNSRLLYSSEVLTLYSSGYSTTLHSEGTLLLYRSRDTLQRKYRYYPPTPTQPEGLYISRVLYFTHSSEYLYSSEVPRLLYSVRGPTLSAQRGTLQLDGTTLTTLRSSEYSTTLQLREVSTLLQLRGRYYSTAQKVLYDSTLRGTLLILAAHEVLY